MSCDHKTCGYTWPNVRVGEAPVQGENEPDDHFAERVAFGQKVGSINWGGGEVVKAMGNAAKREARDMEAYKSLREQGYQPAKIDGAADLADRATSESQVCVNARKREGQRVLADRGLEFTS